MKSFGRLSVAHVKSPSLLCWHCVVLSASLWFGLATCEVRRALYNFLPFSSWKEETPGISNPWYLKNQENQDYSIKGLYLCTACMFTSHPHTLLTISSAMFSSIISSLEFLNAFSNVKKVLMLSGLLVSVYTNNHFILLQMLVSYFSHDLPLLRGAEWRTSCFSAEWEPL